MNSTPTTAPEAPAYVGPSIFSRRILGALNVARYGTLIGPGRVSYGHIYAGTVTPEEKARRRKAGKAQRAARKEARRG